MVQEEQASIVPEEAPVQQQQVEEPAQNPQTEEPLTTEPL